MHTDSFLIHYGRELQNVCEKQNLEMSSFYCQCLLNSYFFWYTFSMNFWGTLTGFYSTKGIVFANHNFKVIIAIRRITWLITDLIQYQLKKITAWFQCSWFHLQSYICCFSNSLYLWNTMWCFDIGIYCVMH